jgi:hypothetical protein
MERQTKTEQKWHILQLLQVHDKQQLLQRFFKKRIQEGRPFSYWLEKNHYYYYRLRAYYRFAVPEGARVLALQCKNGYLLDAVKPSYGVGIDTDPAMISQAKEAYPRHRFHHGTIADIKEKEPFDYILFSTADAQLYDLRRLLESLKPFCHAGTRLVIDTHAPFWRPLVALASKAALFEPQRTVQDFSRADILNFLMLADYEAVREEGHMLLPVYFPLISTFCNRLFINVPFMRRCALHQLIVARPLFVRRDIPEPTVSVIVPCKNEKNMIEQLVKRLPNMGTFTELIFVADDAQDDAAEEIKRVMQAYTEKSVTFYRQQGSDRADAVRTGLSYAVGDIVMVTDADMSVEPEELSAYYYALLENKGECINGSRFVYRAQRGALPRLYYATHRFLSRLFSLIIGQRLTDTLCGTKALWKDDMQSIMRSRAQSHSFDRRGDFDLLFGAAKRHLKIVDMPIRYNRSRCTPWQIRRLYDVLLLALMSLVAIKRFKGK